MSVASLEQDIYAILVAPDVDLGRISAKRVRKQLIDQGRVASDFVKDNKQDIDALIADVFQRVSAERNFTPDEADDDDDDGVSADWRGSGSGGTGGEKRRRDASDDPVPAPVKKRRARGRAPTDDDEAFAKKLQEELNPKRTSRSGGTGKAANGSGGKRGRKAKSAEVVDGEDGEEAGIDTPKKKRKGGGGFQKPYLLSEPLMAVLNADILPRGQVVKALWGYIKGNNLQNPSDKREIFCDDKLRAVFKTDKVTMFSMNKELSKHLIDPAANA